MTDFSTKMQIITTNPAAECSPHASANLPY
jgi:hypothetical protein